MTLSLIFVPLQRSQRNSLASNQTIGLITAAVHFNVRQIIKQQHDEQVSHHVK